MCRSAWVSQVPWLQCCSLDVAFQEFRRPSPQANNTFAPKLRAIRRVQGQVVFRRSVRISDIVSENSITWHIENYIFYDQRYWFQNYCDWLNVTRFVGLNNSLIHWQGTCGGEFGRVIVLYDILLINFSRKHSADLRQRRRWRVRFACCSIS